MGIFSGKSEKSDDGGTDKGGRETARQQQMRRDGKRAKDNLDKATGDKNRLGNRGRGSR